MTIGGGAALIKQRAILLVPGFGNNVRGARLDVLVSSLKINDLLPVQNPEDATIDGAACKRLLPLGQDAKQRPIVDIYEVHWADLVPKSDQVSPLARLWMATALMFYWGLHPWWIAALRRNRSLTLGVLASMIVVSLWYLTILFAALQFMTTPTAARQFSQLTASFVNGEGVGQVVTNLFGWSQPFFAGAVQAFYPYSGALLIVFGFLPIQALVSLLEFVRVYVRSSRNSGCQAQIAQRLQDMLELVYAASGDDGTPLYDEVVVLGHSMGGVIALEALAAYGNPEIRERTVLITWGSALQLLSYRSPHRVKGAILRAVKGSIPRWIDLYSPEDWLSTRIVALERNSNPLRFSTAWWWGLSTAAHNEYYYDDTALGMLLAPRITPPPHVERRRPLRKLGGAFRKAHLAVEAQ